MTRQGEMRVQERDGGCQPIVFALVRWAPLRERDAEAIVVATERFERDRALVADFVQRAADSDPVGSASAKEAAVIFIRLEMNRARTGQTDGFGDRRLFHMHMERIEHQPDGRMVDRVEQLERLEGGAENIA